MLVLTRRIDESIILKLPNGHIITVIVTNVIEKSVKIGVDAPDDVTIVREELEND